jgi:hypothetical protein
MLIEGGTLSGSQGLRFLHVSLSRLTPSEQLAACDALIDLVATEIVSHMTPDNVIDEMFCDPPPCVPFLVPIHDVADKGTSPTKVIEQGVKIIRENCRNVHIRSQLQKLLKEAGSGKSSGNLAAFSACFSGLSR